MKPEPTVTAYFRGVKPGSIWGPKHYKPGLDEAGFNDPPTPWFGPDEGNTQSLRPMEACWDLDRDGYPEGEARFAREDGWTLVTLWDRSGDHRQNSKSVFAIQADLSDEEALGMARLLFPEVFARIEKRLKREVRLAPATCPLCRQSLEGT